MKNKCAGLIVAGFYMNILADCTQFVSLLYSMSQVAKENPDWRNAGYGVLGYVVGGGIKYLSKTLPDFYRSSK